MPDTQNQRSETPVQEILLLNQRLLDAVSSGSWDVYRSLCDPSLSCFEPEARGELVEGLDFHRFYFATSHGSESHHTTMIAPRVRLLGENAAVVTYIRLVQSRDSSGSPKTMRFEETRIWHRQENQWRMVHLHRSTNR